MGSGASKSAAQGTIRKFPNRSPGSAMSPPPSSSSSPSSASPASRAAAEQVQARIRAAKRPAGGAFDFEHLSAAAAPKASLSKNEAIRSDGHDPQHPDTTATTLPPDLAQRLREIGVVQPNPTYSHSSTASSAHYPGSSSSGGGGGAPVFPAASQNAVLSALEVRRRVQGEAEREFENLGLASSEGRRFLPAGMIRDILVMRERGASEAQVENRFNLKKSVIKTLGPRELYKPTTGGEPMPV